MNVSEAVERRISVRAFRQDPVPGELLRELLQKASRAPSGGNVQPWIVHALAGQKLTEFKSMLAARQAAGEHETPEYDIYPAALWDPYRTYRFECGEDLYRTIDIPRENKAARFRQIARNFDFYGAPVGLFFFLDRRMGPPQWADLGMYMQTVMLLAVEYGLDSCAQEIWAHWPKSVAAFFKVPETQMLFAGMSLGYRDPDHPINSLRTKRAQLDDFAHFHGF
jgi:nitroreductase